MSRRPSIVAAALLISLVLALPLLAKVTGKISGVVVNARTGEPLIGASVRVAETNLVTKTDEDGEYFIIGVPVGKYNISVTHVGFETITQTEVRVLLDLTTPVDFAINEVAVELDEEMVVHATAPIIQKDLTASRVIFTEERLKNLPNMVTVQSVLTNYPGVIVDGEQSLHVRGGRSGQITYFYDGFSVQDPFTSSAGIRIMPSSLEELSLTSGGFTAEYGEALSGVVSAVTREGTARYRGRIRTYKGATHPYDIYTGDWGKLKSITNRSLSFDLSGPIPGVDKRRFTFFTAGEYLRNDSYLPHNWYTSLTGTSKITMQPMSRLKLKANFTYNDADGAIYEHRDVNGVSYDFNLDGLPLLERKAYLLGVSGNYAFSDRTIMSVTLNRFFTRTHSGPAHLLGKHWSEWPGYAEDENGEYNGTIHSDNYGYVVDFSDPAQVVGFTTGDDFEPTYSFRESKYNSLSATVVNQVNKTNQLKGGFEIRKYEVDWDFKQFYNSQPYGELYSSQPLYASAFIEDKLEYDAFVMNFGLRVDHRNSDISYNYTPEDTVARWREAEAKTRLSPRLGVSFPISVQSVLHFNYGLYYQVPQYRYLYMNLQGDRTTGLPLIGNPDLEPEETISYELGLDHLINNQFRIDLTAYYKDINDLVTTRQIGLTSGGNPLTRFTNDDYGSVTGVDLAMELLPGENYFSGSVSYSYMMAKGNGSDPLDPYYSYITSTTDTLAPITEYPLDFDQRHTVTAVIDYRVPREWPGRFFGMKLPGAWGLSMVGYYGSGLPYTKTDQDGHRLGERNEGRLPASYSVDMRFNKDFHLGKDLQILTLFVEVDNLFNSRNVINVYTRTGRPDDDAVLAGAGLALDTDDVSRYNYLYDHDPQNYSPPRTVRFGLEYSF